MLLIACGNWFEERWTTTGYILSRLRRSDNLWLINSLGAMPCFWTKVYFSPGCPSSSKTFGREVVTENNSAWAAWLLFEGGEWWIVTLWTAEPLEHVVDADGGGGAQDPGGDDPDYCSIVTVLRSLGTAGAAAWLRGGTHSGEKLLVITSESTTLKVMDRLVR